jgi:hypothetical protein
MTTGDIDSAGISIVTPKIWFSQVTEKKRRQDSRFMAVSQVARVVAQCLCCQVCVSCN